VFINQLPVKRIELNLFRGATPLDIHHTGGRIGIQQNGMLGCIQSEGIAREFETVEEKAIRILNRYDAEI
jgi:hypothetical protein